MSHYPRRAFTLTNGQESQDRKRLLGDSLHLESKIKIRHFSTPGLTEKLVEAKGIVDINAQINEELLRKHYADMAVRPFSNRNRIVRYNMDSSSVAPMVRKSFSVVKTGRQILGETDPAKSLTGTTKDDVCNQVGHNIAESDDIEAPKCQQEVHPLSKPEEQIKWGSVEDPWMYE